MDTVNHYAPPESEMNPSGEFQESGLVPQSVVIQLDRNQRWLHLVSILSFLLAVICILGGLAGVWGAWKLREMSATMSNVIPAENWKVTLLNAIGVIVEGRLLLGMWVFLRRQMQAVSRLSFGRAFADLQKLLENQRKFWRLTVIWGLLVVVTSSFQIWTQFAAYFEPSDKELIEMQGKN